MKTTTNLQITGKAVYILGVLIILLSPVIFRVVVVPLVGWEAIVGKNCVYYNADHTRVEAVTNPGASFVFWIMIGLAGYAVLLTGKKIQRYAMYKKWITRKRRHESATADE